MPIANLFSWTENGARTHDWCLVSHDPAFTPSDDLARLLAQLIMERRCCGCPQHYAAWKCRFDGGEAPAGSSLQALTAFIKPVFGLPGAPGTIPQDHLEGYVAMQLWYFLTLEAPPEQIVRIEPPDFLATDRGGDGMVIHRTLAGYLMFRLWEIKKNTGSSPISSTINTAYGQLRQRATEYLARYTTVGQQVAEPALEEFYGRLIELWVEARPEAAAGVAVATSTGRLPSSCFSTFGDQFPEFTNPRRLRGMLTAVDDFPAFARKVQAYVWTGL